MNAKEEKRMQKNIEELMEIGPMGVREQQVEATIKAVDYAHKNKIDFIIAPEAEGRASALLFRQVYKKRYPNEQAPQAVFVNFRVADSSKKIKKYFPKMAKALGEGKKPMIYDICTHRGRMLKQAADAIQPLMKEKVITGVVTNQAVGRVKIKPTFHGSTSVGCRIFTNFELGMESSKQNTTPYGKKIPKNEMITETRVMEIPGVMKIVEKHSVPGEIIHMMGIKARKQIKQMAENVQPYKQMTENTLLSTSKKKKKLFQRRGK